MIQLEFESIKDELILVSQEAHAIVEEKQPKIENEPNFVESLEEKKNTFHPQLLEDDQGLILYQWDHHQSNLGMLPFIQKITSILLRWTRKFWGGLWSS